MYSSIFFMYLHILEEARGKPRCQTLFSLVLEHGSLTDLDLVETQLPAFASPALGLQAQAAMPSLDAWVQGIKVQSACLQGKHLLIEPSAQSINPFDTALIQCMITSFKAYSHPRDPSLLILVKFTKKTHIP